jgi:hypothetical protein
MQPVTPWLAPVTELMGHAEKRPDVFFPVLSIVTPIGLVIGVAIIIVRYIIPAWRDERKADREHMTQTLADLRGAAALDMAQTRELASTQHAAIVADVSGKVDRVDSSVAKLHDKVDRQAEAITKITAKLALGILVLVSSFGAGVAGGYHLAAPPVSVNISAQSNTNTTTAQPTTANECPKGCPKGQHCCSTLGACCEDKKAEARLGPTSAVKWTQLYTFADGACHGVHHMCWK